MRAVKRKGPVTTSTAGVLLKELREECETVVRLIRQLEKGNAPDDADPGRGGDNPRAQARVRRFVNAPYIQ